MGTLGDLLSTTDLNKLIDHEVAVEGQVYRMRLGEDEKVVGKNPEDKDRKKFFIVVGKDTEGNAIGFVLINTEINKALPIERQDLHYPLRSERYEFLDGKDRYVDCSDFKIIKKNRFQELFLHKGRDTYHGEILAEDLEYIKGAIVSYEDASPKLLKRFGLI